MIKRIITMLEGKAVIGETDMLQTMQQNAVKLASRALDEFDVTDSTEIARFIKKVFSWVLSNCRLCCLGFNCFYICIYYVVYLSAFQYYLSRNFHTVFYIHLKTPVLCFHLHLNFSKWKLQNINFMVIYTRRLTLLLKLMNNIMIQDTCIIYQIWHGACLRRQYSIITTCVYRWRAVLKIAN